MDKVFQRAMGLVRSGILPIDRTNILFFIKIQAIAISAAAIVFTAGVFIGYYLHGENPAQNVQTTQVK